MTDTFQKWIDAGYEQFARKGPEGINVEELSRILDLNKSGYYHHFGDREVFFSKIMEHHNKLSLKFYNRILQLDKFFPDFLDLLYEYKTTLFVQVQLHKHIENPLYYKEFMRAAKRNEKLVLPLWADFIKLSGNRELASYLWDMMRDIFFTRVKIDSFTRENIYEIVTGFSDRIEMLRKEALKE